MKIFFFLCFSVLFTNLLLAQGGAVGITGASSVEVGVANTYALKFTPTSPSTSTATYSIDFWSIIAPVNGSIIQGYINNQSNPNYFYNQTAGTNVTISNSSTINIPFTFGDQAFTNSQISVYCSGFYRDGNGAITGSFSTNIKTFDVRVFKINTPTISNPTILSCCTNNVQFRATDFGDANQFTWTISGGTYTGSGSSITVTPVAGNGSVVASCVVSRSSGLSTYTRSSSRTVSRTARTATYSVSNPPVFTYAGSDYLCKGTGRVFSIAPQCGLQSVTWSAPNCTITGQGTINATITPNSTVANGSILDISASVLYDGGCSAQTQNMPFTIFDTGSTTTPLGTVSVSANPPNVPLQNTSEWLTSFRMQKVTSINYGNGIFVLNPSVLQVESYGRTATVEVCYLNVCSGNQSCANFQVWVPGIANWNPYKTALTLDVNKIEPQKVNTVYPNPTNGLLTIVFDKSISGTYQIFDLTGRLIVQEGKINNQTELQLELFQKLISGTYILKVNTESNSFTDKIILNR